MLDVQNGVRIYSLSVPEPVGTMTGKPPKWQGFLICTAPTESPLPNAQIVPSGAWTIKIRNMGKGNIRVRCMIQTDQSTLPSGRVGRRSYFDDKDYQRFTDIGGERDAILFDDKFGDKKWTVTDSDGGVTRHGSMNASSTHKGVACVAGLSAKRRMPDTLFGGGSGARGGGVGQKRPTGTNGQPADR